MVGILLVTHGRIASELKAAAEAIAGSTERLEAVGLDWNEDASETRRRIEEALARLDGPGGVLVLTDMFGGTPSNLAFPFLQESHVEIATGANLPMVLRALSGRRNEPLPELAHAVAERGRKSIEVASELLAEKTGSRTEDDR
jgi:PTS system mannose-specific IIA component